MNHASNKRFHNIFQVFHRYIGEGRENMSKKIELLRKEGEYYVLKNVS